MLILAEAEHQANEIGLRAYERVSYREIRRQNNIDAIVEGAAGYLPEEVSPEDVNEDWIVNFFELSQDIGNADMQQIWSKILAGEVNKPGSFTPRTLQVVKSLTKEEAQAFTTLSSFAFSVGKYHYALPILSYSFYEFIRSNGLSATMETHLKNIGLLSHSKVYFDADEEQPEQVSLRYFSNDYYTCPTPEEESGTVDLCCFPFTEIGSELASISGAEPNKDYIDVLLNNEVIYRK